MKSIVVTSLACPPQRVVSGLPVLSAMVPPLILRLPSVSIVQLSPESGNLETVVDSATGVAESF